jgi:membrane protein implicated in regulation of membrane protease activity
MLVMSYMLYIVGFMIVIGGLIYGAVLLHMPTQWIVVGSVILLGIAILTGVKATRQKDPSK